MARKDGQEGRKRFRSTTAGGGEGLSAAAGFAAGVAFALLWIFSQSTNGWASSSSTQPGAPPAQPNTTAAASSEAAGAAGINQTAAAAVVPEPRPLNFLSAAEVAEAVFASAKAAADEVDKLMDVDALPHLFLSYGNAAYFKFVHNWALSVQQLGVPYVIGSFDSAMAGLCANHSLACVRAQFATADDFRTNFAAFRAMGAVKVQLVLEILERHPRLPLLVVSDSDTVWLRQPWPYFEQRPAADFFISTDCNSLDMEDEWPPNGKPGCGHIPGKNWGIAFNTGLFAARNRPVTRRLLAAWVELLTNPAKERDKYGRGMEDQLVLNVLFTDDGRMDEEGAKSVGPDEPRLIWAFNGTLRLQTLPVALFSGGHVAFVQRNPWKRGIVPIVIHATFQRWWSDGKRQRLREFGLWHTDGPEYYGAAPATPIKFLTYENGVVPWVEEVVARRYSGRQAPLFYKMWLGMSYQIAAFRDALATARMLGRALVMPTLWCWCDYAEWPDILLTCIYPGGDYEAPFQCPLDFMLDVQALDWQHIQYRPAGFLDLPQVPAYVKNSRAVVRVAEARPAEPFPRPDSLVGHAVTAWPGIAQDEVERVVQPVEEAAVLEVRGFLPGFLGPWRDEPARDSFDEEWGSATREARWCCATWGSSNDAYSTIGYALPRLFKDGWQPWTAPKLELPEWCDKVTDEDGNRRFVSHPQHPCKFLRDPATAPLDDSS